jgi:hypothetical protein
MEFIKTLVDFKCQVITDDCEVCNKPAIGFIGTDPNKPEPETAFCEEHYKTLIGESDKDAHGDNN